MFQSETEGSLTRDSKWRKKINLGPAVDALDKLGVKADELTIFGGILAVAGAVWAYEQNKPDRKEQKILGPVVAMVLGITTDLLDGSLARKQGNDPNRGQLVDVITDRISAIARALLRAETAGQRNNKWGQTAALGEAITLTLPSLAKAIVGSKGVWVPENGRGPGVLGTQAPRTILEVVAAAAPSLQPPIDTALTLGNVFSTVDRIQMGREKNPRRLSQDDIDRAHTRKKYLEGLLVIGLTAAAGYIIGGKIRDRNK